MTKRRAAVAVAKERNSSPDGIVTLSTGVRVRIQPVSATLIDKAQSKIKDPTPPKVFIDEKGREELNWSDPQYLQAKDRAAIDRVVAAMDALVLFGVDLVDGLPEDEGWVTKLKLMERMGSFDLSDIDLDDPLEREFAYKRYIALGPQDIALVSATSGLSEGDVAQAEAIFRD